MGGRFTKGGYYAKISIDIETYSDVDLTKCGVYKYAESPNFAVLLFGYSVDEGAVQVVDLANGEKIPHEIIAALEDENVTKWAYNANFERVCLSRFFGYPTGKYLSCWLEMLQNMGGIFGIAADFESCRRGSGFGKSETR